MMNNIDNTLDTAFNAFNEGDLETAERLARDVVIVSPTHGDALYLLGLIAYRRRAYEPAADLLYQAMKMYPHLENYQLAFAEVLRVQGHLDEALSYYQKVRQTPEVQTEMGLIHLMQGQKDKAKTVFELALKQNSDIAPAYLGLAELTTVKKQKEKLLLRAFELKETENTGYHLAKFYVANKDWEKAQTVLKPYLVYSRDWTLYGVILAALGHHEEALNALRKATELDAYDVGAWTQTGLLLEHQKKWPEAEKAYTKALALDSDDLAAHAGLSNVLVAVGKTPQALEHMRAVILKNPEDMPTLFKLAVLLQETENYEDALGLYFKLLSNKAKISGLNGRIKSCLLSLMKTNKTLAKRFIKGWIKSFPKNKIAVQMGRYLKLMLVAILMGYSVGSFAGDDDQLVLEWEAKLASQGDPASQFFMAESFHYGRGMPANLTRAVVYYKKAAEQGFPEANMALGKIYEQRHEVNTAMTYYEAAAKTEYVPAMLRLAQMYETKKEYEKSYFWYEKAMRLLFPNAKDLSEVSPDIQRLQELLNEQKN